MLFVSILTCKVRGQVLQGLLPCYIHNLHRIAMSGSRTVLLCQGQGHEIFVWFYVCYVLEVASLKGLSPCFSPLWLCTWPAVVSAPVSNCQPLTPLALACPCGYVCAYASHSLWLCTVACCCFCSCVQLPASHSTGFGLPLCVCVCVCFSLPLALYVCV